MPRLRLGLARAATIVAALLFWTWTIAKAAVTLIGASTVGDDFNQLGERLPTWVNWLLSTPWWVPSALAATLTGFLIWLSWPQERDTRKGQESQTPSGLAPAAQPLTVVANQQFVRSPIRLDGHRFINCSFEQVFVTWDGGPYSFENCQIDATRVDGFQTNNPAISEQMRLFAILGLLHPRGTRGMGLPIEPADEVLFHQLASVADNQSTDFTYEVRNVGNHWLLAVTNNGDEATFSAKLDLDGLSAHWLRKPAETLDGTWGLNQNACNTKIIARGAREAMYLFEVSRIGQTCQSFVWGSLNNTFWGISSGPWDVSCPDTDTPHGVIRVLLRSSAKQKIIPTIHLSIRRDGIEMIAP